jgi:tRNA 5-methylaminomethyl-2-thiouridine biosynthesis bifunctional protein
MKLIVIGAGLAGAACAYTLAQQGCEVTVLEASAPLENASPSASLPAALMAAHTSTQDIPISQLSRIGLAATTRFAQSHLQAGQDWQPCGALLRAGRFSSQPQWAPDACWVRPAALLNVLLAHPRIRLQSPAAVKHLRLVQAQPPIWQALDAQGKRLAQADAVILANAYEAKALLCAVSDAQAAPIQLPELNLQSVVGQVVMGEWNASWEAAWPDLLPEFASALGHLPDSAVSFDSQAACINYCAVNGNGHFLPAIPWHDRRIWLSGSTYEHDAPAPSVSLEGQQANLDRLQSLIPAAADLLATQKIAGQLQGWAGSRCTTHDRLPVVGLVSPELAPQLAICTALGSRGASFALPCAEHLASVMLHTQHSPLSPALAKAIAMRHIN